MQGANYVTRSGLRHADTQATCTKSCKAQKVQADQASFQGHKRHAGSVDTDPNAHASMNVMHSSKVYTRLADSVGLADHPAVLNVMLAKVAKNLQCPAYMCRLGVMPQYR
eukprot:1159718-Pelagomonas_calceolata.AAC.5